MAFFYKIDSRRNNHVFLHDKSDSSSIFTYLSTFWGL